jgi:hypothetical protein
MVVTGTRKGEKPVDEMKIKKVHKEEVKEEVKETKEEVHLNTGTFDVSDMFGEGTVAEIVPDGDNTPLPDENPYGETPVEEAKEEVPEETLEDSSTSNGDLDCYAYFAMEFMNNGKKSDPLTLCVITNNNETFYAEFLDYDHSALETSHLLVLRDNYYPMDVIMGDHWTITGDRKKIGEYLLRFLKKFYEEKDHCVQFVGDKLFLEFPILILLITEGAGLDKLPTWIIPNVIDFNLDLRSSMAMDGVDGKNLVPNYIAYVQNRDALLVNYAESLGFHMPEVKPKNVYYEAYRTRLLYLVLWGSYDADKYKLELEKFHERKKPEYF